MTRTPLPREVRRVLAGNTLSAFGTGFTLPFLLIYLHEVRGIALSTVGLVLATLGVVALGLVPIGGTLIDRLGAWRVLVVALLIEGLGTMFLAGVHSPWQGFVAVATIGAGGGIAWPAMAALVSTFVPVELRPRAFAIQFALLNLGIGVGGAISGLLVDVSRPETFELIYLFDGLSFFAFVVVLLAIPRAQRGPVHHEQQTSGGYRELLADRVFLRVCALTLLLVTAGYAQIQSGFTAFAVDAAAVSTRVLGFAFAANTAVIVAGQLFVQRRLEGHRRTRAMAAVGLIWAASWVLLGVGGLLPGRLWPAALVIGSLALFGFGETLFSPTSPALVNDLAPDHLRGRYNAMSSVTWSLSSVLGPVIAGSILGAGLDAVFIALLVALCLGCAVFAVLLERHLPPAANGVPTANPPNDVAPRTNVGASRT